MKREDSGLRIPDRTSPAPAILHSSLVAPHSSPLIRRLGMVEYLPAYEAMRRFTAERTPATADELWILEHPPVYTVGVAGRSEHFPRKSGIPLMHVDRGGQITYHGPGQVLVYVLLDMARRGIKVRDLVSLLEQAGIDTLACHGVRAGRRPGAPGVYVAEAKIAALGLRVRAGRSYHGIAFNVDMDLTPYLAIDPCGYPDLRVTHAKALGIEDSVDDMGEELAGMIAQLLDRRHG